MCGFSFGSVQMLGQPNNNFNCTALANLLCYESKGTLPGLRWDILQRNRDSGIPRGKCDTDTSASDIEADSRAGPQDATPLT